MDEKRKYIEFRVEPFARQTNIGWQPAIRIYSNANLNGTMRLETTRVFEMTFTEEKYALPIARMLAQQELDLKATIYQRLKEDIDL